MTLTNSQLLIIDHLGRLRMAYRTTSRAQVLPYNRLASLTHLFIVHPSPLEVPTVSIVRHSGIAFLHSTNPTKKIIYVPNEIYCARSYARRRLSILFNASSFSLQCRMLMRSISRQNERKSRWSTMGQSIHKCKTNLAPSPCFSFSSIYPSLSHRALCRLN